MKVEEKTIFLEDRVAGADNTNYSEMQWLHQFQETPDYSYPDQICRNKGVSLFKEIKHLALYHSLLYTKHNTAKTETGQLF